MTAWPKMLTSIHATGVIYYSAQASRNIGTKQYLTWIVFLTWEANICGDRWKGKGFDVPPVPWAERLPFSKPLAPDTEASRCPMPMAENAPGAMANCPGWNNSGDPALRGLKNCWLCRPDRARLCKWPGLKWEGLSVWTMRGEKTSLLASMTPLSESFLDESVVSFLCLLSVLSFSRFLILNMDSSFFSTLGLSLIRSSHLELKGDSGSAAGLLGPEQCSSGSSSSCSLSVHVFSSVENEWTKPN